MKWLLIFSVVIFSASSFAQKPKWYQQPGNWFKSVAMAPKTGKSAPVVLAKDVQGNDVDFANLEGDYSLLIFWASWCGNCRKELPVMAELSSEFKKKNVNILAVNVHDDESDALTYIRQADFSLPWLLDEDGKTAKRYRINPLPTNVLIDNKTLKIVKRWKGANKEQSIKDYIKSI